MWPLSRQKTNKKGMVFNPIRVRPSRARRQAEKHTLEAFTPAFTSIIPNVITSPIVLASPHSGRLYPKSFLTQTRLTREELRLCEDCYVDEIFAPLTEIGLPFLHALFPRCFVDANRSETEWPPNSVPRIPDNKISPRAKAGLGVTPTCISRDLEIYDHPLQAKHIQTRIDQLYHPYHNALSQMIERTKRTVGHAILLDCHSMPGILASGQKRADIILGDRFGKSCHPETIDILQEQLQALGYEVIRNIPYAGGFITSHYGRPNMGVQAIQIEINKDLYLNPHTLEVTDGMEKLSADMYRAIVYLQDALKSADQIAAQ